MNFDSKQQSVIIPLNIAFCHNQTIVFLLSYSIYFGVPSPVLPSSLWFLAPLHCLNEKSMWNFVFWIQMRPSPQYGVTTFSEKKPRLNCGRATSSLTSSLFLILHLVHCFKFLNGRASPLLQWRDEKLHNGYADGRETAHANVNLQSGLPAWRQMIQWQCWAHSLKMIIVFCINVLHIAAHAGQELTT